MMLHGYIYLLYPTQPVAEGTGMFLTRPSGLHGQLNFSESVQQNFCEILLL